MGDRRYTYSASGNPLTIEGGDVNRTLTWDAENRLRRIYDSRSGQLHLYTYNHLGERALKRYGKAQTMAVNDKDAGALLDTKDNYSAYVSPYFVGHNNRYTKHYYAGTMRLASKIGGAVYKGVDGADGEQADLEPGSTYTKGTDEPDLYFYHTDHLGSTTYITDRKEVAQYVAYTPYGETFKEYKNVTPYKFNGKELDQETGYYYYGARYYDPGTALWFGVDPLQHKYPMNSPYVYCNGNPISRIDYNGMDWYSVNNEDGTQSGKWFDSSNAVINDGGLTYTHFGKTMSGFNADGSFVYGAQDGQLYNSASLNEVTVNADQSALMTRSIHSAQNDFLSSDYTNMAVGLMGGMMAGPAALEYGYNAAVWSAPYVKSAAIKTYNAVQYYGSSEIIKSIHKYGKLKNNIGMLLTHGFGSVENDMILGGFYGVFMYVLSPDAPEISINPIFDISNKLAQIILYYAQLITDPK